MRRVFDPYRELGVPRGAGADQIRAAHRRLAKRFHPDAATGDRERFLALQEAYQLLTDPLRRREWDRRHAPGPVSAADRATQRPRRDPASRTYTWSAAGVPWWEDFRPRPRATDAGPARAAASDPDRPSGDGGGAGTASSAPPTPGPDPAAATPGDMDAYVRSSGAAWSMAARRYFRRP